MLSKVQTIIMIIIIIIIIIPIPIFLICNRYRPACQFVMEAWGLDV